MPLEIQERPAFQVQGKEARKKGPPSSPKGKGTVRPPGESRSPDTPIHLDPMPVYLHTFTLMLIKKGGTCLHKNKGMVQVWYGGGG